MVHEKVILLVEDNANDERLTMLALEKSNVLREVVVARDGVEALDYLFARGPHAQRDASDLPALVLLDLKLPRIDGIEVLRRIRSEPLTKMLPVVIFTSSSEERDLVECYSSGCNSYVCKPIDFSRFVESVRQLGLYWLVVNEAPPVQNA
jgi:two-component system response regulator